MSKRIVIVGAGGFGRGVYSWLTSSPRHLQQHTVREIVFVDDSAARSAVPVVSTLDDYYPEPADEVICAIGAPATRFAVVERLSSRGATFHTFVDDRALLGDGVKVSKGTVICPGTVISAHADIGRHVHINFNCSIGHDTVIGPFTTLSPSVNIMGEVHLDRAVFLGGSAVVLPRIQVGARAIVGAGAVVVDSVESDLTVVGVPAVSLLAHGEVPT